MRAQEGGAGRGKSAAPQIVLLAISTAWPTVDYVARRPRRQPGGGSPAVLGACCRSFV